MRYTFFKISLVIIFSTFYFFGFTQINKNGIPFLRNFSPKEYNAHNQNWAVVRDKRGIIYVGNNDNGVLEYDGKTWRNIPVPNNSIVRSLTVDSNGTVYVGTVGEFGRLQPDASGKLIYQSLNNKTDTSKFKLNDVWKTYVGNKNEVYFCALGNIIICNNDGSIIPVKLPQQSFFSFYVDGILYISNYIEGLLKINGDKVENVKGGEFYINRDIFNITTYKRGILLIYTDNKGLFLYNTLDGTTEKPINNEQFKKTDKFLIDNNAYCSTKINDDLYAWGTYNSGIGISEKKGKLVEVYNDSIGLQDNKISDIYYCKDQGIIWATQTLGISKVEFDSPIRYFSKESKLSGTIYDIIRYNGTLYVATEIGLYELTYKNNGFPIFIPVPGFKGQTINVFKLMNIDGEQHLIIGSSSALSEIYNNKINVPDSLCNTYIQAMCVSSTKKNTLYIGDQRGLRIATYKNGKFTISEPEKIKNLEIRSLSEDNEGNLWIGSLVNGVYKLATDGSVKNFTTNDGLPVMNDIFVSNTPLGLIFSTAKGFYEFDKKNNKFIPKNIFGNKINLNNRNIRAFYTGFNNQYWVNIDNKVFKFIKHYDEFKADTIPFKRLPQMSVQVIYSEPDGLTWIGGSEGLYYYDNNFKKNYNVKYNTIIRSVTINANDSILFNGTYFSNINKGYNVPSLTQPSELKPTLQYKFNNLTFTFAAPYFEDENNLQYSYMLEGLDEKWSKWSSDNKAVYTNLNEGKYIFKVKALNVFNIESNIGEYEFEISPPWWRTTWAYIGYIIIGILILIFSIKIYTRKLEADKRRLEGIVVERTAEVVRQKDEILDKNKEIEHKNKDITDSILYAKRIQEALLPTENALNNDYFEYFIYFKPKDIVSGDFYFLKKIERSNVIVAAAVDCTGHGVPGAFMSMLGISFLNEIISKPEVTHSDIVLNRLRESIIESLNQSGREGETKDGMDINLIAYEYLNHKLEFSGANNPLYLIRNGELIEYKGDKMPVGLHDKMNIPFSRNKIDMQVGDIIYLFSDGFADQFGGEKGKKYMYKHYKEFLTSIHTKPMKIQRDLIEKEIIDWRGEMEQVDDHIIMGIKVLS